MEIDRWGRAGIGAFVKKVVFETGFKAAAWKWDWNIALNWCSAEQIDRPGLFHAALFQRGDGPGQASALSPDSFLKSA
jgi:hypothetical protein